MNPEEYPLTGNIEEDLAALAKIKASQETPKYDPAKDPFVPKPLLERLGAALPMATMGFAPGGGILGRMAFNTGIGGASEAMKGGSAEDIAKVGLGSGLLGGALEKAGEGVRYVGSAIPKKMFDAAQESKVAQWLWDKVPWWKGMSPTEMATSTAAKDALRQGYDEAFTAARDKIPEAATAQVPLDVANALKLKGEGGLNTQFLSPNVLQMLQRAGKAMPEALDTVAVNARDLLDKLPGSTGKLRAEILRGLEETAGQVIPEARDAYKTGMGWLQLANRGGIGKEGAFDAMTAQRALIKPAGDQSLAQKALGPRGMGELEDILRGPLSQPIEKMTPNSLAWHLGLGGAGALSGLGLHGIPGLAGATAAMIPRPTFYRNVPAQIPQIGQAGRAALSATMPGFLSNMLSTESD